MLFFCELIYKQNRTCRIIGGNICTKNYVQRQYGVLLMLSFCVRIVVNKNETAKDMSMKYCLKCKRLHNDEDTACKTCGGELKIIKDDNTPVYLLTASGFELQRVKAALEDSAVPCDATIKKCIENKYTTSVKAYTGYDDMTYDVYVPYAAYEKAFDTCVGIGAIKLEDEEIIDDGTAPEEIDGENFDEQFEKMTGRKRTTVRIVSALLLLLIVAAVVFGTDFIMKIIMGFFGQ